MCQMKNPREAKKTVNRSLQKIRQLGISKVLVQFLHKAVLVCFTGQRLHGYLENFSLSLLAWCAIKRNTDIIFLGHEQFGAGMRVQFGSGLRLQIN